VKDVVSVPLAVAPELGEGEVVRIERKEPKVSERTGEISVKRSS
jgi:hypothetical protein